MPFDLLNKRIDTARFAVHNAKLALTIAKTPYVFRENTPAQVGILEAAKNAYDAAEIELKSAVQAALDVLRGPRNG